MKPRIEPVADEAMTAQQIDLVASYRRKGGLANVIRTFAAHPDMFAAYKPFGMFCMSGSSLPPVLRELAILRIGVLNHCDYEWGHHVEIATAVGVPKARIEAVKLGGEAGGWSVQERAVLRAADHLHARADLGEELYQELTNFLAPLQVFELILTVGNYVMITMVLNSLGVALENGYSGLAD